MTELTERTVDAFRYCLELHGRQTRKVNSGPYIAHLLNVCALVLEDGGNEDEAIAALLHDALEDRPDVATPDAIARRFGSAVASLVISCTDTPPDYRGGAKPPWRQRKEAYLEHVSASSKGELRLIIADKLSNAREMLRDYRLIGDAIWSDFNAGKDGQVWFYRSLVNRLKERGAGGPSLSELERIVSALERPLPSDGQRDHFQ